MFTKSNNVTDFLFATPNFLTGAGTVMNLAGSFYQFNVSSTSDEADSLAIKNDFYIIGNDLKDAISKSINNKRLAK